MPEILTANEMQKHVAKAAQLLKILSNEHRLLLLCTLINQELSVSELNQAVALSQSSLSQHLGALREAGLVKTRRDSQTIYYSLNGNEAIRVIEVLKGIYCPDL